MVPNPIVVLQIGLSHKIKAGRRRRLDVSFPGSL